MSEKIHTKKFELFLGVLCTLENHFNKTFHWIVCMLHFNELPLRHVFCSIDGTTTGPNSFSGIIGKRLTECELLPVKKFQPIYSDDMIVYDKDTLDSLSKDQQYLYQIVRMASKKGISTHLWQQKYLESYATHAG